MRTIEIVLLCILLAIILSPALFWILMMASSIFVDTKKEYTKNSRYCRWLLNTSTFYACIIGRIHLNVSGLEKIPKGTRFELVGNHTSKFDPILQWYVFRKYDVAFVSKEENFHIPFYGRLIRKCCFYAIDRKNPANAVKTLTKCESLIKNDECCVGIYPEGTRGRGDKLLPFHNGIFYVAKNTGVPIVVVATKGTIDIHRNFPFRKTEVFIDVVDVIPPEFISNHRTTLIGERVKDSLEKKLYESENSDEIPCTL